MAFSGIPLPRTVADVGPGGPLVTGLNALNDYELQRSTAQYNPLKTVAQAASQMAYSNLMGPQFLAKLMNNPGFVANSKDPKMLAQYLQEAASQPTGANALTNPQMTGLMPKPSIGERALNYLLGKVGLGGSEQPQQNSNALLQQPNAPMQNQPSFNSPPGQSMQNLQGNQGGSIPGQNFNSGMSFDKNGNNSVATDDQINAKANQGSDLTPNQQYAQTTGEYQAQIDKAKKMGGYQADDYHELGQDYKLANENQFTIDQLSKLIGDPVLRQIRSLPLANQHEIGWYRQFGNSAQKDWIGRFDSDQGQVVINTSKLLKGPFRAGEQSLVNGMKPNDKDMPDVMVGKTQAFSLWNQMNRERSDLASDLMEQHNISMKNALKIADKQINGDKIRDRIDDLVNPMVTIENEKGERKTLQRSEAKKKYNYQRLGQ